MVEKHEEKKMRMWVEVPVNDLSKEMKRFAKHDLKKYIEIVKNNMIEVGVLRPRDELIIKVV